MVFLEIRWCSLRAYRLIFLTRDGIEVDVICSSLTGGLTGPEAEAGGIALDLAVLPLVAGRMAQHDGYGTLLLGVHDELAQIPAVCIDDLVLARGLHPEHLALATCAMQLAAGLARIDVAAIVVAELHYHIVAGLQGIVHLVPASLVEECPGATSGHRVILDRDLCGVEELVQHTAPPPHRVVVLVLVLDGAVTDGEDHRASRLARRACLGVNLDREQILGQLQPLDSAQALGGRLGVDPRAEGRGVDAVDIEHGLDLLLAKPLELARRNLVEVYERNILGLGNLTGP